MIQSAWIFIGVLATLATVSALYTRDDTIAMVSGSAGFVTWGIWSYASLTVEVVGDSTVFEFSMPPLVLLGVVWALIPAYIALTGPVEIAGKADDARKSEEPYEKL